MEDHVHLTNRPCRAIHLLTEKAEVTGITATLLDVGLRLDEHPARPTAGITNLHVLLWLDHQHHGANDLRRSEEFPALFARRIGEEFDEVFVGRAKQVGKLEVSIAERNLIEVLDQFDEGSVGNRLLSRLAVEVDVPCKHILQRLVVGVLNFLQCFVQS